MKEVGEEDQSSQLQSGEQKAAIANDEERLLSAMKIKTQVRIKLSMKNFLSDVLLYRIIALYSII